MHEIFRRLNSNPGLFAKIIIASFFVNILALATPIYVIQVLQRYVAYGVSSTLITLVSGIVFVSIFEFFFRNIRHRMTREIESENTILADKVMKKIVSIKSNYYTIQKNFRSDVVTKHLHTVQNTLNATTTLILVDVPFITIFLTALFLIHYQLGIITSLFVFIPYLIMRYYRKSLSSLSQSSQNLSIGTARLHDNSISRFETVKYFNLIDAIKKAWETIVEKLITTKENLESQKSILTSFMAASTTFLTIIIIAWGAVLAVNGQISVGALIGANILASRALAPVIRLMQNIEPLNNSKNSISELNKFLNLPQDSAGGSELVDFKGFIKIKDLYFQYPDSKIPVFEGLNCEIKPGELVAIKGSNGSGKTTLIKSIVRLLDFNRGQIFYDNIEINQLSLEWLKKCLIYLPQEPKFIDGNLLDNLLGLSEIKKDKMNEIMISVNLSEFVNQHPDGIKMPIFNRGEDLPFGIRKRMALARALVINGQIAILDEPTESIDEKGRIAIYNLIKKLSSEKKTIIISTQDSEILDKAKFVIDLDFKPVPQIIKNKIKVRRNG